MEVLHPYCTRFDIYDVETERLCIVLSIFKRMDWTANAYKRQLVYYINVNTIPLSPVMLQSQAVN